MLSGAWSAWLCLVPVAIRDRVISCTPGAVLAPLIAIMKCFEHPPWAHTSYLSTCVESILAYFCRMYHLYFWKNAFGSVRSFFPHTFYVQSKYCKDCQYYYWTLHNPTSLGSLKPSSIMSPMARAACTNGTLIIIRVQIWYRWYNSYIAAV